MILPSLPRGPAPPHFTQDLARTSTLSTHLHMILPSQPRGPAPPHFTQDLARTSTLYTHLHMILPSLPRGPAPPHFTQDLAQTSTLYTHLHMILPSQPAQGTGPSTLYTRSCPDLHTLHTLTHDLAQPARPGDRPLHTLHKILPGPPHFPHTYT